MTLRLGSLAIVLFLGWSFASAGDLLLGRRSRGLVELNEAFLVGLSAAAFLIFPLTLLLPHRALPALIFLLVAAVPARVLGRKSLAKPPAEMKPRQPRALRDDPVATGLLVCLVVVAALFAVLNLRYSYFWDGFQIWASKAMVLFHQKGLVRTLWSEDEVMGGFVRYPNLVPLYEALLAFVRGEFEFNALKPVFLAFFVSLLLATYDLAASFVSRRAALLAALLVGSLPALATRESMGGYADMPLACYYAAAAAASLQAGCRRRTRRSALPFLAGGALLVKDEGVIFVAVGLGILGAEEAFSVRRDFLGRLRGAALPIAVMAFYLIERFLYPQWARGLILFAGLDVPSLSRAVARIGLVATETVRHAVDFQQWGLLWPVFVAAAVVLISRGDRSQRRMALAVAVTAVLYASIFLMTNWEDVPLHIEQAFPRLLSQIAPIAVVVIVSAWWRLHPNQRKPREA